jgi:HSP20 family protein
VKREHVKVSLEDRYLRVHGERPKPNDAESGMTWRRMERPKGRFNRRYPMPDLDALDVEGIAARLEDGVLTVTIPLKQRAEEKVNVKNIEISI